VNVLSLSISLASFLLVAAAARPASPHPLDSLTAEEIRTVAAAIQSQGLASPNSRFASMSLVHPDKSAVWSWREGLPFQQREAMAVIRTGREVREIVVSLGTKRVISTKLRANVQIPITGSDWSTAAGLVKADQRWRAAMRLRGITDFKNIFCDALSVGTTVPTDRRRLLKVPCYDARGTSNVYGRPIEGVMALVDLDRRAVIELADTGLVPISSADPSLEEERQPSIRPAPKPVGISPANGWNFVVDGGRFRWGNWSFHLSFDKRVGPVISTVRYRDAGSERPVLYQGHVSEMFVPYMDPDENWAFRAYMDVGDYGFGHLASTLVEGADCPSGAMLLSATLPGPGGAPYTAKDVMCAFERDTGVPLWRRSEIVTRSHEVRQDVAFVLRTIPTVGNYDYVYDWVFSNKGEIAIEVGATGIAAAKGVRVRKVGEGEEEPLHGALVGPHLVAPDHDHFLSFRLDLDVDGTSNRFVRDTLRRTKLPMSSSRRSRWTRSSRIEPRELAIRATHEPELWRIENSQLQTALGYSPSFEIVGHAASSLLDSSDPVQARAAFSAFPLWVTAYKPSELYAAGDYPNQSPGGQGLPKFVDGERIVGGDLVVWYTMGFHHITRPEDWPVLPTVQHKATLRPHAFFVRNPSMDLPGSVRPPEK
jgi:primary-amine oxidase